MSFERQRRAMFPLLLAVCSANYVAAQSTAPSTPTDTNTPEVASHDEAPSFKSKVNLVIVPVVVRDSTGKVIQDLTKEDFQIFDKGKPQVISKFSVEKPAPAVAIKGDAISVNTAETQPPTPADDSAPDRFIAYLFDDIHLNFGDLVRVRDAARRHMDKALRPTDRAAIYTTSGRVTLEFTDDRDKLHETLLRLRPTPVARSGIQYCPDVSYYQSEKIDSGDTQALQIAVADALQCLHLDPTQPGSLQIAQTTATSTARIVESAGAQETHVSFTVLNDVIRRLTYLPGKKSIILVSPGYYVAADRRSEESDVLEKALHANVVISALDARGLYTDTIFDASQSSGNGATLGQRSLLASESASLEGETLAELAYGTGGTFAHNTNDYDSAFVTVDATPECIYLLGFSPDKLKFDGSFHGLKVKLTKPLKFDMQARKGYYAPRHVADPADAAKEEIQEALFSRDETHDLPVDLNTQFFRSSDTQASLSVLAHVNLKQMHFRKAEGRNHNALTVVAAIFDRDGNYVKAIQKTITMQLRDETLIKVPAITIKSSFDIPPGRYVVRLVVRDTEGQLITAENRAVEIPY